MLTAAISTLALALAIGPQLQLGLQVALDEAQSVAEAPADTSEALTNEIEETVETVETPEIPKSDELVEEVVEETSEALETLETPVAPEIAAPTEALPTDPTELANDAEADLAEEIEPAAAEETLLEEAEAAIDESPALDLTPPVTVQSGEVPAEEWPSVLSQASAALSAAKTAKGNFIQTNADGSITTGTFALNRPGRMRFDYDDPTPILIVSDGTTVAMEDSELETVDRVPIGATPLGLILSTDLNVDEDVEVLSVMQNADGYGIRVADSSGELEGTLTMVFNKASFELLGWLTTDGNFRTTVVDLVDTETNVRVDPRLFRLDEAEDEEDER